MKHELFELFKASCQMMEPFTYLGSFLVTYWWGKKRQKTKMLKLLRNQRSYLAVYGSQAVLDLSETELGKQLVATVAGSVLATAAKDLENS